MTNALRIKPSNLAQRALVPMGMRVLTVLIICVLVPMWSSVFTASAQDKKNDTAAATRQMDLLRLQFERNWITTSLAPLKKQLTAAATLEKQLATAHDYDGAIRVRDQQRRWQAEIERLDKQLLLVQAREQALKAAALPDRITLAVDAATLNGVKRDAMVLTSWEKAGASATWSLPALPPGGYEVVLRYRCTPTEGGEFIVKEKRFTLSGTTRETGLGGPVEHNLGTLKLSEGATSLTLTAAKVPLKNLMQLHGIELIPSSH